jgi:S1-C subfamily serine protease
MLAAAAGIPEPYGLLVTHVAEGGNADAAGLRGGSGRAVTRAGISIPMGGDVIVEFNSQRIASLADYLGALQTTQPGDVVELTVLREGQRVSVEVELVDRASAP